MAPARLETEDHQRDASFNQVLHGKSSQATGGLAAMRRKDAQAQKAAVEEYFKHWDNKSAAVETDETREVRSCPFLSRHKYRSLTDLLRLDERSTPP
jgi:sterol 24-C-methyltransferase